MKRPFRRFEVIYLAAALAGGAGCTPDHSVKPGAPVLTEVYIVEAGGAPLSIPAGAQACAATAATGVGCDPSADTTCFQPTANNWCRCNANPAPMSPPSPSTCDAGMGMGGAAAGSPGTAGAGGAGGMSGASSADAGADAAAGTAGAAGAGGGAGAAAVPSPGSWDCHGFAPATQVVYVFDRLLDTRPLDPGDAGGPVAAATIMSGAATIPSNADYASTGSAGTFFFPLLGDFRADGPSLLVSALPALPASAAVTIALDGTQVRAKDGKTPFTDNNMFNQGAITLSTVAFVGSVTAPQPPPPADACTPPSTTVALDATGTITFNSPVDPAALMNAVTVTMGTAATPVPFVLTPTDSLNFTVSPAADPQSTTQAPPAWPANASITITVPDTLTDLNGEVLGPGPGHSVFFMTGAS